jgi:hypothetical protein
VTNLNLQYCLDQIIINWGKWKETPVYQDMGDVDKRNFSSFRCIQWRGKNALLVDETVQKATQCDCSYFPDHIWEKYRMAS